MAIDSKKIEPSEQARATANRAPRGRPRAFDREKALAEAMRLFWIKGYEATSIADLTSAMGIGSPSLYAAFGSKNALYAEALSHYGQTYEPLIWARFFSAPTARASVQALLMDSAAALTGCLVDIPHGCMVALAAISAQENPELAELVRANREQTLTRLTKRLRQAKREGEIPPGSDVHALARFVQTVQNGMSILAKDGATRGELESVAKMAMLGWSGSVGRHSRSTSS